MQSLEIEDQLLDTYDRLKQNGFLVRTKIGTSSHVLYFCSAPFGRSVLVIEDYSPQVIHVTAIQGDEDNIDSRLCVVQDNTILLTYPGADYTTYYSIQPNLVEEKEYYIVSLEDLESDVPAICLKIDAYFVQRVREDYEHRLEPVKRFNKLVELVTQNLAQVSQLSKDIDGYFDKMNRLRNRSNRLLTSDRLEELGPMNTELEDLLISVQSSVQAYSSLVSKFTYFQ